MNEALRGAFAVCGHTLFCAPYAAAAALHMNGNRITKRCFQNRDFYLTFAASFIAHFIWNTRTESYNAFFVMKLALTIAILWFSARYVLRKWRW